MVAESQHPGIKPHPGLFVFWDFDGTLVKKHCLYHLREVIRHYDHRPWVRRLRLADFYSKLPRFWWNSKQGSESFNRFFYHQFRFEQQRYEELLLYKVCPYFQQQVFEEAVERIRRYKRQGATQCIVSASPKRLVARMAEHLGIDHCIATDLKVVEGFYRGAEQNAVVDAEEKAVRVQRFLEARDVPREHMELHAYGNSQHDIPMLKLADQAHAVNPDGRLRKLAEQHSWTCLRWGEGV